MSEVKSALVESIEQEAGADGVLSKGEQTRVRLLIAAEEVFGELPYFEASVSEICRRAQVSQGTFYNYFPSKQVIYSELVRHIGHSLRREIAEAVDGLKDRKEIERKGFEAFFGFLQRHMKIYRIVRQAEFVDRSAFIEYYRQFAIGYVDGLKKAQQRGEVRKLNPEVLAYCLMAVGDFVGMRWILWPENGGVPQRVLDQIMDFIFAGMSADG
ncbi:MAG: TetR/AcrR family transcriptional regulator [Actinomycetota bacterium]